MPTCGDFVEWVDGRAHPRGLVQRRLRRPLLVSAAIGGFAGTPPFTATFAQRTTIRETPVSPVRSVRWPMARSWPTSGRSTRRGPACTFASGEAGQTVAMRVGYLLDPDGQVSTLHGTQETNLSMSYIMRSGTQTFEGFTYLGFRYLQVDDAPRTATAPTTWWRSPGMPPCPTCRRRRWSPMTGCSMRSGSCAPGRASSAARSNSSTHPTREKGPFLWDGANESEGVMRAYGDRNMTWQALRDVARGQTRYWPQGQVNAVYPNGDGARTFGTSTARYPEWLWRYAVSTGDLATVRSLYPSVTRAVTWLWSTRQNTTGLLYGLADTDNGDPVYGYDLSVAADTVSNVLAVNAMRRLAQLATMTGDDTASQTWQTRAAQLAESVNAVLRRPDGTYVDGVDSNGAPSGHASQEANALALAYGVVPASDLAAVGAYVAGLGIAVGPNHGLELLRGLAAAGMPEAMVHALTDTSRPGWAHIVAAGGTFTWEVWRPSDLIGDSMSHGWGSSALVAMQETLLGVALGEPETDGTIRVVVSPPSAGLARAQGSVPTIAGPVLVSWQRRGKGMAMTLTVPVNAVATVRLPASAPSSVREGGVAAATAPGVTVLGPTAGVAELSVGSGTYHFTSS